MTIDTLSRRAVMAGLSTAFLPGAAWAQSAKRDVEGGIGGTGIVGVLTHSENLIVSGNRLETDTLTKFSDGFGQIDRKDLMIGDSLTVEAAGSPDNLVARRVHVTYPLVGRVSSVSADASRIVVNGIDVALETALSDITVGLRVAVSGLWRGTSVIASRVAPTRSQRDLISGDVRRSFGAVRLGETDIRGRGVASLAGGSFATIIGNYEAARSRIQATDLVSNRFVGAAGALGQLSIEGYLEPVATAPGYRIAGLGHSFANNLQLAEYEGSRVLFNGPYTGKFAAERALVLPNNPQRRRSLLAKLSQNAG
ncbi:MAG: DUF5666 domain-containing protein [Paracoccaceae bacterium]|nr:DUF5666 domain-containing protein [Paracoccaceae bacterium]